VDYGDRFNLRAARVVPILFEAMAAFDPTTANDPVTLTTNVVEAPSKAVRSKAARSIVVRSKAARSKPLR